MASKDETKFIRDERGVITKIENPHGIPESVVLIPFMEKITKSVKEFDQSTTKYSKRMEKLTYAIMALTVIQLLATLISVYLKGR